ncbi:hypothetical protein PHYC_00897 [Phycisphaerales bacterium]|nr:hypothetical protein PHYC_00897 [Phycisphaerales bacterium]
MDHAELLRTYLAGRHEPCPGCGYDLRGLTTPRCPECNQLLTLRVRLAEPRIAAWITGLIGLAFGTGFNFLLLIYFVLMVAFRGMGGELRIVLLVGIPLLGLGPAIAVWLWKRGRIQRCRPPAGWGLAVGCWLATLGSFASFLGLIR